MIDLSLVALEHLLSFVVVFGLLAAIYARRSRGGKRHVGVWLAAVVTFGALVFVPTTTARAGLILAALVTMIVGTVDEVTPLRPRHQLIWQTIIAIILVISGWIIPYVSNPLEVGIIDLRWVSLAGVALPGGLLAVAWLVLMMNAVNWLDGADGLAGGVSLVGFFALAAVAALPSIYSGATLGLALVGAAGVLAFFIWNFPPAKIYLGTVGSWFVGMYLALVAMHGGGKIATALLILALPVLDAAVVMFRRWLHGRPIWQGDTTSHIHHRLRARGISSRQIVAAAMVVTGALAAASILITTEAKILLLGLAALGLTVAALHLAGARRRMKGYYGAQTTESLPHR